ncbi:ribosomal protein S12 methylthiotransferase accessory factor [Bradyrhizobium lablabi]|uniref:Ribosomal protein S12 methylthiotransferase accessory factor n=3 Tax=Nitrobacteraceae TaxID=41294 RepID=A0ABY0Q981_9BRAD|nr:ribosomal protein S12 methylthiotransferase accessory factor [Bradyrhizobium ottawaense]SEC20137.1 ribosomal protein S12 methylthiotransferase accessory factor [Bradyrhizobium lablabi]
MGDQQHPLTARLEAAASALVADPAATGAGSAESGLLRYLGYDDGDAARAEGRARMLRAAARFRRLFLLPVPDAPGLVFFGGEADPAALGKQPEGLPTASLAGSGLSPQKAFESCVGEGIEYLSQFVQANDPIERGSFTEYGESSDANVRAFISGMLAFTGIEADRPMAWVPSSRLVDGARMWFPLDLCYRRQVTEQDFKPPLKLSSGCAAGVTREDATLRALLELIERDAVALWWRGGRRGRPVAPESAAASGAAELLAQARQGQGHGHRTSWLLDITTDIEMPVVAAISTGPDGHRFAVGFGARLTLADAARAAVFELCQVELGLHVVAAKRRESGDEAMNESDRRQLKRGTFDTRECALLHPMTGSSAEPPKAPASSLRDVLQRLQARDIAVYAMDLTRPQFLIPVVRVLAPGLQLEPCEIVGARLARVIAETGGGAMHHGGMPLL